MEKPVRRTLLPGVSDAGAPPPVIIDSRVVVARARRRAAVRDVIDLLLLVGVDGLFLRWPLAHVPFLDRYDSLMVLVALNAPLAQLYNDRSVLESFHCAAYSQILRRYWPEAFSDIGMRKLMINSILFGGVAYLFGTQAHQHSSLNALISMVKEIATFQALI